MASPNQPKQMSSRLLTMKFMQRSAAKTSEPSTPNGRPSKRQRLSKGTSTPGTPSDHERIQAAIAAEDLKRTQAIERQAAAAGESKWFLSFRDPEEGKSKPGMRVVQAGFAVIDGDASEDSDGHGVSGTGRRKFGKVKEPEPSDSSDSDSNSEAAEDDEYDPSDPTAALIREGRHEAATQAREDRKAKKRAAQAEAARLADSRRRKEVNLNKITSISGFSGKEKGPAPKLCFICNKAGHMAKECPNRGGGQQNVGAGQGRKRDRGS